MSTGPCHLSIWMLCLPFLSPFDWNQLVEKWHDITSTKTNQIRFDISTCCVGTFPRHGSFVVGNTGRFYSSDVAMMYERTGQCRPEMLQSFGHGMQRAPVQNNRLLTSHLHWPFTQTRPGKSQFFVHWLLNVNANSSLHITRVSRLNLTWYAARREKNDENKQVHRSSGEKKNTFRGSRTYSLERRCLNRFRKRRVRITSKT